MHGYDVVDHQSVNEGWWAGGNRHSLRAYMSCTWTGARHVPNHMSVAKENVCGMSRNGRHHATSFFDIDWDPSELKLRDKILLPYSRPVGRELSAGKIKVLRQGTLSHRITIRPSGSTAFLSQILGKAADSPVPIHSHSCRSHSRLPAPDSTDRQRCNMRVIATRLYCVLCSIACATKSARHANGRCAIEDLNNNADAWMSSSTHRISSRLSRTGDQELGYRRFFDVNSLVGLRVEREHVFDESTRSFCSGR